MAEFRLERFKYNWRGNWATGVSYKRDDIVRVNGKSYVCVVTHVSSATFRTDLLATIPGSVPPQPQPKWKVMTDGRSFEGDWTNGTAYNLGDIVQYDGSLWVCSVPHTASNFASDFSNWNVFAQSSKFDSNWQSNTSYGPGAIVKYNGISYKCITAHTSGQLIETDINNWEVFLENIEFQNDWNPNTEYRLNDLVKYGGNIYRCTETHTSNSTNLDDLKFEILVPGFQYGGEWNNTTYYNQGDVVNHRGFMYYAVNNNVDSRPYDDNGSLDWILLSRTYNFVGPWSQESQYKTGDIVLRGGNLYLALRDIGNDVITEESQQILDPETGETITIPGTVTVLTNFNDGSTLDYLDEGTWELLVPGKAWKGNWAAGTTYSINDVVYFKGSSYTCNTEHEASILNFPGDNGNVYNYWDILMQAGREGGLRERGDILTYGLSREIDDDGSTIFDGSTLGDVRLAIGEREQILSVSSELEVFWRNIVENADTVYVSTNGIDDDDGTRGTYQKPFKTIRYAAEYVEDNFDPLTPVIIRVSTGRFEEIAPIIVPAGCSINGDELRSTTVIVNPPISEYQNDYQYVQSYISRFIAIVLDIITNVQIQKTVGNNLTQDVTGPISTLGAANIIVDLLQDYQNFIEFRIGNGNTNPLMVGTNERDNTHGTAATQLYNNRNFIAEELVARLKVQNPSVTFNESRIKLDIKSLLRALRYDLVYPGNYKTLLAGLRYANAVNGSQLENLFYMRDTTGLRDLTTDGLQGTLNPPGVFDLYQKPTGGACVSLDPGWGPADERTWIINRSPYMQGVTNIGTGCVGMKVDGALHNGGNKSMVANDFTQVLSDGIGAWVTNNARTELVSVFTYYCQIGYFAEDGGVIRATNGNNSYGKYGSIADGADDTETPQVVTAFNRNNDAQVAEAFAGGTNDQIFLFEYSNAGEEYSQASATILGAGANANVEYMDFRDGGLFEARLISPDGSSNEGGAGYLVRQGSAQETLGASSTIILSQTDVTQFLSEIEGMRLIITDGTGVGQYGYVSAYDFVTKTVTVRKESNNELGWDHIVPGTPIATNLDLTTRYRIEPRISVSAPGFSLSFYDLFTNRNYVDVVFGDTTQTFNGITASGRYLWEDDISNSITIDSIISSVSLQFSGQLATTPTVPFTIQGKVSGTTAVVSAITANTGSLIEADVDTTTGFVVGERLEIVVTAGTGNTFDDDPIPAVFNITRAGKVYSASIVNPGAGYSVGDKIVISGTQLGGSTPANDATITVSSVSQDSTNSIQSITVTGTGKSGKYVSLTSSEYYRFSNDGINWTEGSLPFIANNVKVLNGNNRFIAVANNESRIASSLTGESWTSVNLPLSASWSDGVYGGGKFVLVADDTDLVASSSDGITWATGSIPNDTVGDSTISQWTAVTYGKGIYVAVSANDRATATSTNGTTWTRHDSALPDLSPGNDWSIVSVTYGNNRFVVMDDAGRNAYSFDGITWYQGTTISVGSFTPAEVKYSQGVFLVIGTENGATTTTCATSEDGMIWTSRVITIPGRWTALTYGIVNDVSKWVLLSSSATTNGIVHLSTGARAKCRADVVTGSFRTIKIWDPGSGYTDANPPVLTITDPNPTVEIAYESRIGNGVLAQPSFINRGSGYRKETSQISISGNGFADIIPTSSTLTVSGVENIPGPGVQIRISGIEDPTALVPGTLAVFSGVEVFDLGDDGTGNGTRLIRFTISPSIGIENIVEHGTTLSLRERYSQCRITGHDFLDIGTGNFEQTNYPEIYAGGRFFTAAPENEVYETNGGRVFYVSTDQDGNFRTGELFAVQQATGIVTISAQFFDLQGLSELALGGVRLGGSGTVVNEFSTDPTFAADSNNVIPTQRAIATFLANRLSVGGENLEVNRIVAGRVAVGGTDTEIDNVIDGYLNIPVDVSLQGTFATTDVNGNPITSNVGISGTIISQMLFLKRFESTMQ